MLATLHQSLGPSYSITFSLLFILILLVSIYIFNIFPNINLPISYQFLLIFIIGLSNILNALSTIQEQKLFWQKSYKFLIKEQIFLSVLIAISYLFSKNYFLTFTLLFIVSFIRFTLTFISEKKFLKNSNINQ